VTAFYAQLELQMLNQDHLVASHVVNSHLQKKVLSFVLVLVKTELTLQKIPPVVVRAALTSILPKV